MSSDMSRSIRGALKRFFWFCSGADISLLDRDESSTEQNKYVGIGATVLLTALLASLSGGYALFTVFRRYPQSIIFGALWGILIFNLDRYIVLSMRSERTSNRRRVLTALPRVLLALLISIVVTVPLELKIFDREINNHLNNINNRKFEDERARIENGFQTLIAKWEAKLRKLEQNVGAKEGEVQSLSELVRNEVAGIGPTHQRGRGSAYREDQKQLDRAEEALRDARGELESAKKEYQSDPEVQHWRAEKESATKGIEQTTGENTGILARLDALHDLMLSERTTFFAFCLLALLFLTLETAPVLTKLLSKYGPYDALLDTKEAEIVEREEQKGANAKSKAINDLEHEREMQTAIRNTEREQFREVIQALPSDPRWITNKTDLREEIIDRVRQRSRNVLDGVVPVNGVDHLRSESAKAHIENGRRPFWHRRWIVFAIVLLAVLCAGILFGVSYLKTESSGGKNQYAAYVWRDPTDDVYVAVRSVKPVDPSVVNQAFPNVVLIPSDIESPLASIGGFRVSTYKVTSQINSTYHLGASQEPPAVYLIGETHVGKNQLEVAKVLCDLLNTHEIDAIFLEQPDDLSFDWSRFQSLEQNRDSAILALQSELVTDANSVVEPAFGKFANDFNKIDLSQPDALNRLKTTISAHFGEDAVTDALDVLEQETQRVEASAMEQAYKHNEYVSAVDYVYVMLNLQGITIPFYNVDSAELRRIFLINGGTNDRDRYIADKIAAIVRQNGYRSTVYVGGGSHSRYLTELLTAQHLKATVVSESGAAAIKETIPVLTKSDYIVSLASKGPPSGFRGSVAFRVDGSVTVDMKNLFDQYINSEYAQIFTEGERDYLRQQFAAVYASQQLKGKTKWTTVLVTQNGKRSVVVSWDDRDSRLDVRYDKAPDDQYVEQLMLSNDFIHRIDYRDEARVREINQVADGFLLVAVKKRLSHYALTFGNYAIVDKMASDAGTSPDNLTVTQVMNVINSLRKEHPSRVVYVDLQNFKSNAEIKAFSDSCRIRQNQIDPTVSIITYPHQTISQTFFDTKLVFDGYQPSVFPVTTGEYKGWYKIILNFLSTIGGQAVKITVNILVKSHDLALDFLEKLSVIDSVARQEQVRMNPLQIVASCVKAMAPSEYREKEIVIAIGDEVGSMEISTLLTGRKS